MGSIKEFFKNGRNRKLLAFAALYPFTMAVVMRALGVQDEHPLPNKSIFSYLVFFHLIYYIPPVAAFFLLPVRKLWIKMALMPALSIVYVLAIFFPLAIIKGDCTAMGVFVYMPGPCRGEPADSLRLTPEKRKGLEKTFKDMDRATEFK